MSTKNRALVCPGDFCIDYFQIGVYFQSPPCLRRCFIDYRQTVFVFTDQQQQGGALIIGGGEINIVIRKPEMRGRYNQWINIALCLHSQIKLTYQWLVEANIWNIGDTGRCSGCSSPCILLLMHSLSSMAADADARDASAQLLHVSAISVHSLICAYLDALQH